MVPIIVLCMLRINEVRIGNWTLKELPSKYLLLYMVWYSRSSTITLHRLSLMVYLSPHLIKYNFEIPPIISNELLKDVEELANESLIGYLSGRYLAIKVTEKGRRIISELYRLSNEYMLINNYVIIKVRDALNELSRIVSTYQDMPIDTLLSIAVREESLKLSGHARDLLSGLSFELRNPCENVIG